MMGTRRLRVCAASLLLGLGAVAWLQAASGDGPVLEAIKRRDATAFTALLDAEADISAADPAGATPLAWAVHLGERAMAEALLGAGAEVNTVDVYGETPLTLACANGDGVLVRRLLAAGARADVTRWNGETPLMLAAGAGSLDAVKALVEAGVDVNVAEPERKQTALMWAASEGHSDVVSGLIEMGADVQAVSAGGFIPLVFAVINGDAASVKALVAAGSDPNVATPSGSWPLLVALGRRNTAAAMALLDSGALVTAREERTGNTPLHVAAQHGDVTVVNALLARGADPNVRTPVSIATAGARGGGGGNRNTGGGGGQTPLMLAARGDQKDAMRALVAAGADPALLAGDGSNLLMAAAGGARLETFRYAYELDPRVDVIAASNTTIMHLAVGQGGRTQPETCEVIQFLADHGAALDELDAAGRTPLAVADRLPVDQAVDLLVKLITERGGQPKIPSNR